MTPAANVARPVTPSATARPSSSRSPPARCAQAMSTSRASTPAHVANVAVARPTRLAPTHASVLSSSENVCVRRPATSRPNTTNATPASTIAGRSSGERSVSNSAAAAGQAIGDPAHPLDDRLKRVDHAAHPLELGDQLAQLAPQLDDLAGERLHRCVHLHDVA